MSNQEDKFDFRILKIWEVRFKKQLIRQLQKF